MKSPKFAIGLFVSSLIFFSAAVLLFWRSSFAQINTPTSNLAVTPNRQIVAHVKTPEPVRAIYMTGWAAATSSLRNHIIKLAKNSEVNSIVIDIKDYTGQILFDTEDDALKKLGTEEIRIKDLKELIEDLHKENIYVIARIAVFQDPLFAQKYPKTAVQSTKGGVWKDQNGLSFIDPSVREYWAYIVQIGKAAEKIGFDELNFDYIRFPTDGRLDEMVFSASKVHANTSTSAVSNRTWIMMGFFAYLREQLAHLNIPLSADLFGMTMSNTDDLRIGQLLEAAAPFFDYICPMVYPSHYPKGFMKYANPAQYPYEIVHYAMKSGYERLQNINQNPAKIRPWLQDFDMGARYDEAKVRAQKKAVYDSGLTGWMMWDPKNEYTISAYDKP